MPTQKTVSLTQQIIEMMVPQQDNFTVKEVAAIGDWSSQHIIDCFENEKICGFRTNGKAKAGKEKRHTIRIPRKFVLIFLANSINCTAENVLQHICTAIKDLPPEMLLQIATFAHQRINKK